MVVSRAQSHITYSFGAVKAARSVRVRALKGTLALGATLLVLSIAYPPFRESGGMDAARNYVGFESLVNSKVWGSATVDTDLLLLEWITFGSLLWLVYKVMTNGNTINRKIIILLSSIFQLGMLLCPPWLGPHRAAIAEAKFLCYRFVMMRPPHATLHLELLLLQSLAITFLTAALYTFAKPKLKGPSFTVFLN